MIRRDVATPVTMLWSSRRSDEYCTDRTAWALPGLYGVEAAALEGEPTDVAFELRAPVAAVVTQTAEPTQQTEEPRPRGTSDSWRAKVEQAPRPRDVVATTRRDHRSPG